MSISFSSTANRLSPEFALLGFLYREPGHGYELHQRLVNVFGSTWRASQSQAYSILKRLESRGYISATTVEQVKLPPRQLFHITASGARRFERWLFAPTSSSVHAIRVEFVTRLFFIQQYYPQQIVSIIQAQASEVQSALARLQAILVDVPADQTFNRLSLDLRIRQLNSLLDWLAECQNTFHTHHS